MQQKIAIAAVSKDWHKVRDLQKMLYHSRDAKMLAVQRVTSKRMKRTPGIDGLFWGENKTKFEAVERLCYQDYKPSPFKRIYVPKENDKSRLRPLSVPIIFDRAMQGLFLLGVDPVVESYADMHAYGFRKYRSSLDVIRDVVEGMNLTKGNTWVLVSDVHECFDHLSHEWILKHAPMSKKILRKILQCGYVHKNIYYSMKEGMPQGGVLSPVFTTLVLCGMEGILEGKYPNEGVKIIRYVDDYLFTGRSKEIMECVLNDLQEFLEIRGLTLSESKTKIVHISEGFNFIGWHFVRNNKGLEISPSVEKMDDVLRRMGDIIVQGKKWDPEKLILKLNDIVSGWGCYHAYKCTPDWFIPLDDKVSSMLWKWVKNKHPDENNQWILNQYWRNRIGSERIFGYEDTLLLRFEDIQIREPDPLDLRKNPYIDIEYFRGREKHIHVPTSERAIELKQRIW